MSEWADKTDWPAEALYERRLEAGYKACAGSTLGPRGVLPCGDLTLGRCACGEPLCGLCAETCGGERVSPECHENRKADGECGCKP